MGQGDAGFRLMDSNAAEMGVRIRSKKATRRMLIDDWEGHVEVLELLGEVKQRRKSASR